MPMLSVEAWQSAASDVLSVLVVENYLDREVSAFTRAYHENSLMPTHLPPGKWRDLYSTIITLRMAGKQVNWTTLSTEGTALITEDWYTELVTLYDAVRVADFDDNLSAALAVGTKMLAIEAMHRAEQALLREGDLDETVSTLVIDVSSAGQMKITQETAGGSVERLKSIFEGAPEPAVPTGNEVIDKKFGGLRLERMLLIAGAYKSGKTRLALNFLINAWRGGMKPAFLTLENSIETTMLQIVCMFAVEWLLRNKYVRYDPDDEASVYWISPDLLMQAGRDYKSWVDLKKRAIDFGFAQLAAMGNDVRFYDTSDEGGSLYDFNSVRKVVQRDMRLYGGDCYFVDHQGLIHAPGDIFQKTAFVSDSLRRLSRIQKPHRIHLCVLAQLNENTIHVPGGYSPGVMGGGASTANSDYVLRTTPVPIDEEKGEYYNDRIYLQVKQSRWSAASKRTTVHVHPGSGLTLKNELTSWDKDMPKGQWNGTLPLPPPINWQDTRDAVDLGTDVPDDDYDPFNDHSHDHSQESQRVTDIPF